MLSIAHRAANTLDGLSAADARAADVVEADVRWYRGRVEVRHLKTAGPLPFLWDRWELASASAPRLVLEDLLSEDRGRADLMLDLKGRHRSTPAAVAGALTERDVTGVLVCGRHWPSVDEVARLSGARAVLSARNRLERRALEDRVLDTTRPAPYGVSVHVSLLDAPLVSRLHRRGVSVLTWPVDDRPTLDHVTLLGVDGVITNSATVLREVRARSSATNGRDVWATTHSLPPGRRAGRAPG